MGDVWASCVRRWYVLIPALLLSAGLLGLTAAQVGPTYTSTANVVLVPPPNPDTPRLNRFLGLGGLGDTVDVLARAMSSEATQRRLEDAVPGAEYTVAGDPTTSAPLVVITATSQDRADSRRMLLAVRDQLPVNLAALQQRLGIKTSSQITGVTVTLDDRPEAEQKSRVRLLALLAAVLLGGTLVMVAAIDSLLLHRARGRAAAGQTSPARQPPPGDATPPRAPAPEPVPAPAPETPPAKPGHMPAKPVSGGTTRPRGGSRPEPTRGQPKARRPTPRRDG